MTDSMQNAEKHKATDAYRSLRQRVDRLIQAGKHKSDFIEVPIADAPFIIEDYQAADWVVLDRGHAISREFTRLDFMTKEEAEFLAKESPLFQKIISNSIAAVETPEPTEPGPGRPVSLQGGWSQVTIQLEPPTLKKIEEARAKIPRSAFLRGLIDKGLTPKPEGALELNLPKEVFAFLTERAAKEKHSLQESILLLLRAYYKASKI